MGFLSAFYIGIALSKPVLLFFGGISRFSAIPKLGSSIIGVCVCVCVRVCICTQQYGSKSNDGCLHTGFLSWDCLSESVNFVMKKDPVLFVSILNLKILQTSRSICCFLSSSFQVCNSDGRAKQKVILTHSLSLSLDFVYHSFFRCYEPKFAFLQFLFSRLGLISSGIRRATPSNLFVCLFVCFFHNLQTIQVRFIFPICCFVSFFSTKIDHFSLLLGVVVLPAVSLRAGDRSSLLAFAIDGAILRSWLNAKASESRSEPESLGPRLA